MKSVLAALLVSALTLTPLLPVNAKVLQGNVTQDQTLHRIERPADGNGAPLSGGTTKSNRIARPIAAAGAPLSGLVDTGAFAPLNGQVGQTGQTGLHSGLVDSGAFSAPPKNFDLGAERGSKELLL